jgi:NDP-hexose 4-ketoreductase
VIVALVLGAGGFIGRHAASAVLEADGLTLVASDLPGVATGQGFVPIDLRESTRDVATALEGIGPDVIVNCTGRTSGVESELRVANVTTVERLLDAVAEVGRPLRLVHVGSSAEYGSVPDGALVAETAAEAPEGPYGSTKLEGTRLVVGARGERGLDAVVLRVFNAVGPAMPSGSLPGAALARLLAARDAGVRRIELGPLDAVRDFIDVRDIGTAVVSACRAPAIAAPVLNVGTGRGTTARDLVMAIARGVGFAGEIGETTGGSERSNRVPWMVADTSLIRRVLGWQAVHDLDSIAASLVRGAGEAV